MKKQTRASIEWVTLNVLLLLAVGCGSKGIPDDAKLAGLTPDDFPQLDADVFRKIDGGRALRPEEVRGRNDWILWTGGSQAFLERMSRESYGLMDILKMVDSRDRTNRFAEYGLINEPGYRPATAPGPHGLWLDVAAEEDPDNIDAKIAAEGIDDSVYGRSTGIMGLRLYPNPDFDAAAEQAWDAEKFYNRDDNPEWRDYSVRSDLVRPFKVGMTCGLCHVTHDPLNPPRDPEAPAWENLVSALGNQYIREGRVFANNLKPPRPGEPSSFLWEMTHQQPPGTSDTSRIATDHINNPNTINAIFNVPSRLEVARVMEAREKMSSASMNISGDDQPGDEGAYRYVPHVLKDGADSVGVPGATIRVYVNIGMYSQQWLELHKPLVGVRAQQPMEIANAQKNSVYWMATQNRLGDIKAFLASVRPMHLRDAKWTDAGGRERSGAEFVLPEDDPQMIRGKEVFASSCARCHSSKRPPAGQGYREVVLAADFREDNFLSTDERIPVNDAELASNAARALATNAKEGHIWDNFSSDTYKNAPSIGEIDYYNPLNGAMEKWRAPGGGVGFYRVPSLIAIWTSAPLLHNNSVGLYTGDPSVEGRLKAFDDAMEKLLWPEKRLGTNSIWRLQHESYIQIPMATLPGFVQKALEAKDAVREEIGLDQSLVEDGILKLGPIPKGTPINLVANLDLGLQSLKDLPKAAHLAALAVDIKKTLLALKAKNLTGEAARDYLRAELGSRLLANSKCPDLVEDRGHYYGMELPDDDKRALIAFLKTL